MVNEINKDILISVIAGSLLFFLLCVFIVAFTLLYLKKRKEHKLKQEKLASEFAETLLRSELEIKEQTLQNISNELHDNIGLTAVLVNIYLNTINPDKPKNLKKKISESKKLIKQLIKDIKILSLDLNSDRAVQLGLPRILAIEINKLNQSEVYTSSLNIYGKEFSLPAATITILYRMAQEIINNILKHSKATEILTEIRFLENFLTLVFTDNGKGFNVNEKLDGKGNGLINLRKRANVLNAELIIKSDLGSGTTIIIQIPR